MLSTRQDVTHHECELDGSMTGVTFGDGDIFELSFNGPNKYWQVKRDDKSIRIPVVFNPVGELYFGLEIYNTEIEIIW
jgi:hypothetical protein